MSKSSGNILVEELQGPPGLRRPWAEVPRLFYAATSPLDHKKIQSEEPFAIIFSKLLTW